MTPEEMNAVAQKEWEKSGIPELALEIAAVVFLAKKLVGPDDKVEAVDVRDLLVGFAKSIIPLAIALANRSKNDHDLDKAN